MSAEPDSARYTSIEPPQEPKPVREDLLPLLERYDEALRRGEVGPPEHWLLEQLPEVQELQAHLQELYWLHVRDQDRRPPGVTNADVLPRIPGYEVRQVLNRGGMGVVYLARQLRPERLVALKMLLDEAYASPEILARFRTEPEAVARLQHPHIVQVFHVGEHDGHPFFAMEYVDGGSLDQQLAGTPQPPRDAATLLETLACAVHAAHERGVVHRDIKPGNILLTREGTPKITDFGLAKRLDLDRGQTQSGAVVGTPSYMAPEQAAGQAKTVGPAVDVYALGAVLYEMLTGRPPFKAATLMETLEQVRSHDPVPPRRLQPKVPRDLETICLKCLDKEPARRYARAAALAEDLRRFLANEPIAARPIGVMRRIVKWARRRPVEMTLLVTIVVVFLLGTGIWFHMSRLERDNLANKKSALLQTLVKWPLAAKRAHENGIALSTARRLRDFTQQLEQDIEMLQELESIRLKRTEMESRDAVPFPLTGATGRPLHSPSNTEPPPKVKNSDSENPPPILSTGSSPSGISIQAADSRGRRLDPTETIRAYEAAFLRYGIDVTSLPVHLAAERISRRMIHAELAFALDDWAMVLRKLHRHESAAHWHRLLEIASLADPDPFRNRLRAALQQGMSLENLRKLAQSVDVTQQREATLELLGRALGEGGDPDAAVSLLEQAQLLHPNDFWINNLLAWYLGETEPPRNEESVRYFQAALALRSESPLAHNMLGIALERIGRTQDAIRMYRRALELAPHGVEHAGVYNNLGVLLEKLGDHEAARVALMAALRRAPGMALTHANLGWLLRRRGDPQGAIACFREAIRLWPGHAPYRYDLGNCLRDAGEIDEAIYSYWEAICRDPNHAGAYANLGIVLLEQKRTNAAYACCMEALRLQPNAPEPRVNLGNVLAEKGDRAGAVRMYQDALRLQPGFLPAYIGLSECLDLLRQHDAAVRTALAAVCLHPFAADGYGVLGSALRSQANLHRNQAWREDAIAAYRISLLLRPGQGVAHFNLGLVFLDSGRDAEALTHWREAVRLGYRHPGAFNNIGYSLYRQKALEEAAHAYRQAIELNPTNAMFRSNLGIALKDHNQHAEAAAAFRECLRLQPDFPHAHFYLGFCLIQLHRLEEATIACWEAIRLRPDLALAYWNLGKALEGQGLFTAALTAYRDAHALGARLPKWTQPSLEAVRHCERLIELAQRLPAILRGEAQPATAAEHLEFAQFCIAHRKLTVAAARLYQQAFALEPKLQHEVGPVHRYSAARVAALAGCKQGKDAAELSDAARTAWRKQAVEWLRQEFEALAKDLPTATPEDRNGIRFRLEHWQRSPDFAGLRDPAAVAQLPADEQQACNALRTTVSELLKRIPKQE